MMQETFIRLLNQSYQAGIVICFIILARFLLKIIKAPKKYAYYLWGIALVRLIFPFSFENIFSLLPKQTQPISTTILYEPIPQIHTGSMLIDRAVNSVLPAAQPVASVNPLQIWIMMAQIVWLSGFLLLLLYTVVSYMKLKYRLVGSLHLKDNIYLADHIEAPFILGLIRPRIYLPSNLQSNEMEYILLHEQAHLKRRDHLVKMIAFLTVSVHWFNPLAWAAFILGCRDMEMSCDDQVMKTSKQDIRKEYTASLLSFSVGRRRLSATPLAFIEGDIKGRIKNVLHYKKPAGIIVMLALAIMIVLAVCLLSNPESSVENLNKGDTNTEETVVQAIPSLGQENSVEEDVVGTNVIGEENIGKDITEEDNVREDIVGENAVGANKVGEDITEENIVGEDIAGETDIEKAVSQAILTEGQNDSARYDIVVEAHTTLQTDAEENSVTVYAMVLELGFSYTENSITEEGGSHMPVALTFDKKEDGSYTLQEYWRPEDGSYYATSIADKFPADIYGEAIDTQKYIYGHMQACYQQVVEYGNVDTDTLIKSLISEICSSPATSSSLGDYIKEHELESRELRYLGEYTLDYYSEHMIQEEKNSLEGKVMEIICEDINGDRKM